ncbi:MAG TPA: glycosyltransferase family 9 protein [Myxococcaceae bacterium]|jgi:ADP-heptose:LPS heptosyltransferase
MELLKGAERGLKRAGAVAASALLARPGRKARAQALLAGARRVLLVRIDRRVGEALLLTPLFSALRARRPAVEVHALAHPWIARVLEGHPELDRLHRFDAATVRALRAERFEVVVDCTNWTGPSTQAALVARLCAPEGVVVGPAGGGLDALRDVAVAARADTRREVLQRVHLLAPLGGVPEEMDRVSFRPVRAPSGDVARLCEEARRGGDRAVLNPGGRLGERRIPPSAFAAAGRALEGAGRRPIVTWGPGERELAEEIAKACPGAVLAPPTDLDELAALMSACGMTVCNNTGPMHLSVAVGAPTLAFFLRMDMERWGHPFAPHRMVDLTSLAGDEQKLAEAAGEHSASFARRG